MHLHDEEWVLPRMQELRDGACGLCHISVSILRTSGVDSKIIVAPLTIMSMIYEKIVLPRDRPTQPSCVLLY